MRIVSLVPNGTEILFAVGAGELVVGVSHECDFPEEARTRTILTGSALTPGMTAAEACTADNRFLACINVDGLHAGNPYAARPDATPPPQPFM